MVDLSELDDLLERVLFKGIVIDPREDALGVGDPGDATEWRTVAITGVIVLNVSDE